MILHMFVPCRDEMLCKLEGTVYFKGIIDGVKVVVPILKTEYSVDEVKEIFQLSPNRYIPITLDGNINLKTIYRKNNNAKLELLYSIVRSSVVGTKRLVSLEALLMLSSLYIPFKVTLNRRKDNLVLLARGWDCINKRKFKVTLVESNSDELIMEYYKDNIAIKDIYLTGRTLIGSQRLTYDIRNRYVGKYSILRIYQ